MVKTLKERVTPDYVTHLKPDEIFVFGSNLSGYHGAGAARQAKLDFGAVQGEGIGHFGQSYALPTVQHHIRGKLGLPEIKMYVNQFIDYARSNKSKTFLVTEVGCGLAGYAVEEIAPLFMRAVDVPNVHLSDSFWLQLKKEFAETIQTF